MFKCEYCGRELKSKAGLVRHMSSCKSKDLPSEETIEDIEVIHGKEFIKPTSKVVNLEIASDEKDYYRGHPRREIKLRGLLSRTFDTKERIKILQMLHELADANK